MATVRFGPYELVHRLGSGGMAETYLAVRRGPAGFVQHVCVKRILPAFESDPELIRQFLDEARLAATLRHANIAQVIDFGEVGGSHYLALELVDGMDLRALLRRLGEKGERLDPALAVFLGLELASALEHAHQPGRDRPPIVHRDVTPSNVLISRAGEVYLTDFGIAQVVGAKRRTDQGVLRGKVPYMAPEYASTGELDGRADLFGLGVILFEALAGRRPFEGRTELETLGLIARGQHPPLASLSPHAPRPLVAVVERLLRVRPEERFQRAADLIEALAPLAGPPTLARTLGQLVSASGESLSQSLRMSGALPTAAVSREPAPSYPDVRASHPDAETRTADVGQVAEQLAAIPRSTNQLWSATDPDRAATRSPWTVTDPTSISHHDRPSPYAPAATPAQIPATAIQLPATAVQLPAHEPRAQPRIGPRAATPGRAGRGCLWALLAVAGLIAFVAASLGTYLLIQWVQAGGV